MTKGGFSRFSWLHFKTLFQLKGRFLVLFCLLERTKCHARAQNITWKKKSALELCFVRKFCGKVQNHVFGCGLITAGVTESFQFLGDIASNWASFDALVVLLPGPKSEYVVF